MERTDDQTSEPFTAAQRCAERLARQNRARVEILAGQSRDLTLGEQVIKVPLTRDLTIPLNRTLNPFKLADLQYVLNFRTFYGLLPDVDLKEIYFEGAWGCQKKFTLEDTQEWTVEWMKQRVKWALPSFGGRTVYPPGKVDVDELNTKEEIVRAYWELTYVPEAVYKTAVGGAHVLRSLKAGDIGEDPEVVKDYLFWACQAGLDLSVIRELAEICEPWDVDMAARRAAVGGHTDVIDLLARRLNCEFGARIDVRSLGWPARVGHVETIDHIVEEYGVDPNGDGVMIPLHDAAMVGGIRTVKHLIEKHNVDINKRNAEGRTALDMAEEYGMPECAAVLRGYGATNGEPVEDEEDEEEEDDWTESDDWETDDNSDADHDVM